MGQIASLFSVGEARFKQLAEAPDTFDLEADANDSASFDKTFEGLRYILAKNRDRDTADLVRQIFEPENFLGADFDWGEVDFNDETHDYLALEAARIYYNSPATVAAIAGFLTSITDEVFLSVFNPEEMNQARVYPGTVWNRSKRPEIGYNEQDMLDEFQRLKAFFNRINRGRNYCVSYVGY
jgi:hypothetical protein